MNASDLFGVAVRTIGLWFIASAVASMTAVIVAPASIIALSLNLVVGAILFFGADGFTRTAYGSMRRADTSK